MKRVLLIPSLLLMFFGIISYLVSAGPMRMGLGKKRPVVVCYADDVKTLDCGQMSWANDIRTAMALWEGLTTYGNPDEGKGLTPVPGVAKSWEISKDGRTYTFHLRTNARWSNGDAVTAGDFVFAWQRVFVPATGANYLGLMNLLEGGEEYAAAMGKWKSGEPLPDFSRVGVKAADAHTLVVTLKHPRGYFLDLCAFPTFFPLDAKAMAPFLVDPHDPMKGYDGKWTRPPYLVTNGAFRLADWKFKQYLLLERNEEYWDKAHVPTDRLVIKSISDQRAALLAYDSGTVDLLTSVPTQFGEDLLKERDAGRRPDLHYGPVFGTYYFIFNCKEAPFTDWRVRKALSLAVDRKKLVDDVVRMRERPLGLLVPPGAIPGYQSPKALPAPDVEEARKLLAEAGYPGGKGLRPIEIMYNTEAGHDRIAQAIGAMWEKSLGVRVTYRGLERGSFSSERQETHHFDVARGGWYGDYMDPTTWLNLARTGDENNDGRFSDPAYDALLAQADREPDPGRRLAILSQAEGLLVRKEFPFIPLYQYTDGFMFDGKKLGGIEANVRLMTNLKWIYRK